MKTTPTPEMIEAGERAIDALDYATMPAGDIHREIARAAIAAALSVPAAAVVGEPDDAHREAIDHINRLIVALKPFVEFSQNVEFDADLNTVVWSSRIHRDPLSTWFGPSDFAYARFAVGDTTERLPHIAAPSAPEGMKPVASPQQMPRIKWASEMTDEEISAELFQLGQVVAEGFGEGSGSPGEWYYERRDELSTEQDRRAALGGASHD